MKSGNKIRNTNSAQTNMNHLQRTINSLQSFVNRPVLPTLNKNSISNSLQKTSKPVHPKKTANQSNFTFGKKRIKLGESSCSSSDDDDIPPKKLSMKVVPAKPLPVPQPTSNIHLPRKEHVDSDSDSDSDSNFIPPPPRQKLPVKNILLPSMPQRPSTSKPITDNRISNLELQASRAKSCKLKEKKKKVNSSSDSEDDDIPSVKQSAPRKSLNTPIYSSSESENKSEKKLPISKSKKTAKKSIATKNKIINKKEKLQIPSSSSSSSSSSEDDDLQTPKKATATKHLPILNRQKAEESSDTESESDNESLSKQKQNPIQKTSIADASDTNLETDNDEPLSDHKESLDAVFKYLMDTNIAPSKRVNQYASSSSGSNSSEDEDEEYDDSCQTFNDDLSLSTNSKAFSLSKPPSSNSSESGSEAAYQQKLTKDTVTSVATRTPIIILYSQVIPTCIYCGKYWVSEEALSEHKVKKHWTLVKYTETRKFKCHVEKCTKLFYSQSGLTRHQLTMHPGHTLSKDLPAPPTEHKCNICDIVLKSNKNLQLHMVIHNGQKHVCDICLKSFSQKCYLKLHKTIHSDSKPFQCMECGSGYLSPAALEDHLRRRHDLKFSGDGQSWKCENCQLQFTKRQGLTLHIRKETCRSVYGNAKYQCDVCFNCFPTSESLVEHTQTRKYLSGNCTRKRRAPNKNQRKQGLSGPVEPLEI